MNQALRHLVSVATVILSLSFVVRASDDSSATSDIQFQLASLLYDEARYREALDAYERARATPQPELKLQARMGVVRSALRIAEFTVARDEAGALMAQRPRDPEVLALFADSLWASGLFDESEEKTRDALALDPDRARARHGLARALAARGQLERALEEAQAALQQAPRDPEIHHTVGSIYERMHKFDEAAAAYGNYVNLLPNKDRSEKAAWSRAEIRFLRSFAGKVPFEIEDGGEDRLYTVDFKLVNEKVTVPVRINGGGLMDVVVDTGSEQTVLSRPTAERLGVRPITYTLSAGVGEVGLRGLQLARLDSLEIGALKVRHLPCLIKNPPLRGLPTREGESFSPLAIGLSLAIDYGRRQLTLGRRLPASPADVELPLRLHRLATVRGTVDGVHPANFVVDTGGEVISISTATAGALKQDPAKRRIPLKVYGTSGWDRDAFLLPGVDLAFAAIEYRNFPVVVLNLRAPSALLGFQLGGIVGHKFLSRYRVMIDLERSAMRLKEL